MDDKKITVLAGAIIAFTEGCPLGREMTVGEITSAMGLAIAGLVRRDALLELGETGKLQDDEVEEDETPDWEDEQMFKDFYDRAYILSRLQSRYPDEIVRLINSGQVEIPLWLQEEMKKRTIES